MASEIKVDTVSEKTSGSGVTIDGLLIKDGGISGDVSLIGTTPTFTIGDAGAEDAALVFDGNAQDFYIALDDSADDLIIGLGAAVGTTPMLSFTEAKAAAFTGAVTMASTLGVTGVVTGAGFTAGSAVLAEAELELLDGLTAGTAIASKVVTTDASIDTTGQRNLTISGELDAATGDFSGAVDIAGATTVAALTASDDIIAIDDKGIVFGTGSDQSIKAIPGETATAFYKGTDNTVAYRVEAYVDGAGGQTYFSIYGGEAKSASIQLVQDEGDDNSDIWWFGQQATNFADNQNLNWTDFDSGSLDNEMQLTQAGVLNVEGAVNASTAHDYAEFWEWKTELANDAKITETYGLTVVLDNEKVRLAEAGEEAKVLGVVRPNNSSTLVGGAQVFKWVNKYERNVWGEVQKEEYTQVDWDEIITKDDGSTYVHHHKYMKDRIPAKKLKRFAKLDRSEWNWHTLASNLTADDLVVPSTDEEKLAANYVERSTYKRDKGIHKKDDKLMRKKINSSYDPSRSYVSREDRRKEWCIVGLIGQVEVRDSAIVPTHWTKMKNLETGIDLYYIK